MKRPDTDGKKKRRRKGRRREGEREGLFSEAKMAPMWTHLSLLLLLHLTLAEGEESDVDNGSNSGSVVGDNNGNDDYGDVREGHVRTGVTLVADGVGARENAGQQQQQHRHRHHQPFSTVEGDGNITETEMLPEAEVLQLMPGELGEEMMEGEEKDEEGKQFVEGELR